MKITPQDWDKYNWDAVEECRGRRRMQKVLRYIPRSGVHLDVGTGRGDGTQVISHIKPTVGLDYGRRSLLIAAKKNGDLIQGTACDLPFKEGCFSSVTLLDVLEHIPGAADALKEIHRVMAKGGVLVMQTPSQEIMRIKLIGIFLYRKLEQVRTVGRRIKRMLNNIFNKEKSDIFKTNRGKDDSTPQPYDRELPLDLIKTMIKDANFTMETKKAVHYWHQSWIIRVFSLANLFVLRK